jgi:hypothetical protein
MRDAGLIDTIGTTKNYLLHILSDQEVTRDAGLIGKTRTENVHFRISLSIPELCVTLE